MKESVPCPSCGKPLSAGALAGLCPICLLAQGVETEHAGTQSRHRFEPPSIAEITRLFPQLEILGLLGAGGMGAVYKARQPALDRLVALKVLPAKGSGEVAFSERFNREARALARLSHPNIVAVHEFGQVGDLHFFIMEFVDGANLRQLERAKRLAPREALQIIPQICEALQYAHDEGVVHRDIKPENVLVDRKGRVKIADFGLAKIADPNPEATRLTVEGQVMGTPHYMAPEQVERPLDVDHRADIYSLGVVFYEMLTGDLPLGKFAPPSRKVQIDVRLDDIVLRALENDPERRYQQASDVKQGVATVLASPDSRPTGPANADSKLEVAEKSDVRYVRWLGIPVAVERHDEREVNFQGAMAAIFTVMMCAAVAQMFVRWAAGREHALSGLVTLASVAVIVFGIRWAINRPWSDDPLVARRRFLQDGMMLVGLVAFVIGSHYVKFREVPLNTDHPLAASQGATHLAVLDAGTGMMSAKLPGNGALELLAISSSNTALNTWWRPDGKRLSNSTFHLMGLADEAIPTNAIRSDFVFRIIGSPPGIDAPIFDCEPAINPSFGGAVRENGLAITGGWALRALFEKDVRSATLRFGYGFGRWRTVLAYDPKNRKSTPLQGNGDPDWMANIRDVSATNGGLQVTAELGPGSLAFLDGTDRYLTVSPGRHAWNWRIRVVVVDRAGTEHVHDSVESRPVPEVQPWQSMLWKFQFPGLTVGSTGEVRIQVEPIYWVEFRNLALRPLEEPSPTTAAAVFGPPRLLSFDELVDFDIGHAAEFPPDEPGSNPFASVGENILWALENGFDAGAGAGKLELLGATVAEIDDREWEAMTPYQAEVRLAATGTNPREISPLNANRGTSPAYAFRTREGGVGLIRFVEYQRESSKFTVQFRNVRPPAGAARIIQARHVRQTGELIGRLPGRGMVTLGALRAAGSSTWSRPDGTPAKDVPAHFAQDFDRNFPTNNMAGRLWQVLLRADHLPSPEDYLHFEFPGVVNRFFTGGAIVPQGGANPGMVSLHALWPDSLTNATIRACVPMAPWHPIRSFEPFSRSFTKTSWGDEPKWNIEMHTAGVGTKGAQITVVFGTNYPGWNLRLIARRARGEDMQGHADASVTNGPATTRTYVFPSITKLDDVQNFQVQAQPVEWVEFSNLPIASSNRPLHP